MKLSLALISCQVVFQLSSASVPLPKQIYSSDSFHIENRNVNDFTKLKGMLKSVTRGKLNKVQSSLSTVRSISGGGNPIQPTFDNSNVVTIPDTSSIQQLLLSLLGTCLEFVLLCLFMVGWNEVAAFLHEQIWPYIDDSTSKSVRVALGLIGWGTVVFFSGFASVLPKRYSSSVQALDIDNPLQVQWYAGLKKPTWNPPQWAFPIAWIPIKILQMFSITLLCINLPNSKKLIPYGVGRIVPVVLYLVYKALGDTWNKVWFGKKQLCNGVTIMVMYWLSLVGLLVSLYDIDRQSFYLMAPTLPWVTFAAALCIRIWSLNKRSSSA